MSEDGIKENRSEDSPSKEGESSALSVPESAVEAKLQEIIEAVPAPQREEVRHTFQEFMGYVERSGPRVDPEVARILAASNDKDNENKFKYLAQKQQLAAEENEREHKLEVMRHQDRVRFFWPILISTLVVVIGCLSIGIYLAATGHDILGASLITGTAFAIAGYLAGIGTADFFKSE
jgi:hypothetical protein